MESASRVVFGVLLVVGMLDGRNAAAIAIAAAPLLSLFVVPWALGRHVRRTAPPPPAGDTAEPEMTLAHGLGFAGAVLVIMVSEQAILNSGVLIVKAETGDDALGADLRGADDRPRAAAAVPGRLDHPPPHLTRLLVREGEGHTGDFGRSVRLTVAACLAFGGATVIGVLAVGPAVMRLLFGSEFDYDRLSRWWPPAWACTVGDHGQPGRAGAGPSPPGRGVLGRHGAFFVAFLLLAGIEEVREVEVVPRLCGDAGGAPVPRLPASGDRPTPDPARLDGGDGSDPGRRRRGQLGAGRLGDRPVCLRRVRDAEDRRGRDEQRRPGVPHGGCGEGADAAVDLDRQVRPDQVAQPADLVGRGLDERLAAQPGFTVMQSTRSRRSTTSATASTGVPRLIARPSRHPASRICCNAKCTFGVASAWIVIESAPAANCPIWRSGRSTIRWQSRIPPAPWTCSRMDSTITGPIVIGGTGARPSRRRGWLARRR